MFLQVGCFTEVKHISAIFLQDSSGQCLGFTNFYKCQVLGNYFRTPPLKALRFQLFIHYSLATGFPSLRGIWRSINEK